MMKILMVLILTPALLFAAGTNTLVSFDVWAQRYIAVDAIMQSELETEGVALAQEREEVMLLLMRVSPGKMLARAISPALRDQLPSTVTCYLERPVTGMARNAVFQSGVRGVAPSNSRELMIKGETFRAYVYGLRSEQLLFSDERIEGVAIGNELAVLDLPVGKTVVKASRAVKSTMERTGEVMVSSHFDLKDVKLGVLDRFDTVELEGCEIMEDEPGAPGLPARFIRVSVPVGSSIQSVTIQANEVMVAEGLMLYPVQPPYPLGEAKPDFVEPIASVYAGTERIPAVSGMQSSGVEHQQGKSSVSIQINPLRYIPATGTLYLSTEILVTVAYVKPVVELPKKSSQTKADVPLAAVDYLIVTSTNLVSDFQVLANHRATHNGFTAEVVDLTWIEANYSTLRPDGNHDVQTAIRHCIADYVATKGTTCVVLGGDDTVVPDRDCYIQVGTGILFDMPTDLYYSGLDGNWDDHNADGVYGEMNVGGVEADDEGDLAFDVVVGRICARNSAQALGYINKVIDYETNPPDIMNKFMVSGHMGWNKYSKNIRPSDRLFDGHMQFRDENHPSVIDSEVWLRRSFRDHVQPYWQPETFGTMLSSITSWDTTIAGDYLANETNMLTRLNEGWQFSVSFTHGITDGLCTEGELFDTTYAAAMTGLTPFFFTCACNAGGFDHADPCFSEALVLNPNGGALLYVGSSRAGWSGATPTYLNKLLDVIFIDQISDMGLAYANHKQAFSSKAGSQPTYRWLMFSLNYQGDPALQTELSLAPPLTVLPRPDKAIFEVNENQTGTFKVKLSTQPAQSVVVTMTRDSGDADFSIQGDATLTFTPDNWNSYQTVTVYLAEDADAISGTAQIKCAISSSAYSLITVKEHDNDAYGLRFWWPLDGSGVVVADSSGHEEGAQIVDNVTVGQLGHCNSAFVFDGNGGKVVQDNIFDLMLNTVTISGWMKRDGTQSNHCGVVFMRDTDVASGITIVNDQLCYNWNNEHYSWISGLSIPDNEWCFFALVVEPTNATMYLGVNGVLQSASNTATHKMESTHVPFVLGYDGSTRCYKGGLDDVRVYDQSLRANEIEILFQPESVNYPPQGDLIVYYPFNEETTIIVVDESKGDHAGDLMGGTWQLTDEIRQGFLNLNRDVDAIYIADSPEINGMVVSQRTIALWFCADAFSVFGKQVLFEEGGGSNGFNLYLDGNTLYVGAWPNGGFLSSSGLKVGQWYHVALTFDSGTGFLRGYLDGVEFGSSGCSSIAPHGYMGLGYVQGNTKCHDGVLSSSSNFGGKLDEFVLYNRVLTPTEMGELAHVDVASCIASATKVYLSDINWVSQSVGWGGSVRKDHSIYMNPIILDGTTYPKGLGTHAQSEIVYDLAGNYVAFHSIVGIDDETGGGGSVIFKVYGDDVLLHETAVVNAMETKNIQVDVSGVQTLKLVVDANGPAAADHADWADAYLLFEKIYLSDADWVSQSVGWGGTVKKDLSIGGNSIILDGTTYPKGLGTHAQSEVIYNLAGNSVIFHSVVGIDDETGVNGNVIFKVYGDDLLLYETAVITGEGTETLHVNVKGVQTLKLVVDANGLQGSDHGDWADAYLLSDYDDDGLIDDWEIIHFGNINAQDGTDDFDADGASNRQEQTFNTNPIDAGDAPSAEYLNLRAWWKLDDATGNVASDSSGNGADGTVFGASWITGIDGGALSFDGINDKVLRTLTERSWPQFSVVLWVKTDVLGQSRRFASVFNNKASSSDFQLDMDGENPGHYQYRGSVLQVISPVTTEWMHLVVSCDGSNTMLYKNGTLVNTLNCADNVFGQFALGVNRSGVYFFQGFIDDLRVYNMALSASEVGTFYQQQVPAYTFWKDTQFTAAELADPAISGDDVDLDADQLGNLIEYALGLDPKTHSGSLAGCAIELDGSNGWKVEFNRYASRNDIDLVLEWSDELNPANWQPVAESIAGGAIQPLNGATLVSETGSEPTVVEINVPSTVPHGFIRWKVERR